MPHRQPGGRGPRRKYPRRPAETPADRGPCAGKAVLRRRGSGPDPGETRARTSTPPAPWEMLRGSCRRRGQTRTAAKPHGEGAPRRNAWPAVNASVVTVVRDGAFCLTRDLRDKDI